MITLPTRRRGRRSAEQQAQYEDELRAFAAAIRQIDSTLEFRVSSRGWCYILEEHGLTKGEFDIAQRLINECRKSGLLPVNICADDKARETQLFEGYVDTESPEEYAQRAVSAIWYHAESYRPVAYWSLQSYYVEVLVEKIDLKSLFEPVCSKYKVPITNARGWTDLNSRQAMMRRFQQHEAEGRQCVLLYCGDHDPGGLIISESIRSNMRDMAAAAGWQPDNLEIIRFGLNYEFIREQGLSWIDNLETSSGERLDNPRHRDHQKPYVQNYLRQFGARKVEANALVTRAAAGRQLCEEAITQFVAPESLQDYADTLQQERSKVLEVLPEVLQRYVEDMG